MIRDHQKAYDALYRSLLSSHSPLEAQEVVKNAGYIDDEPYEFNPYLITAPYPSLMKNKGTKNAVLLSTGSFDPVHHGHVAMMTETRSHVEQLGYTVIGGVFSVSHDNYVRKQKTREGVPAEQRGIDITNFVLSHKDNQERWMIHDIWESQIVDHPVNFTTVIHHVRKTLERFLDDFTIFYLFGADNAVFALPLAYEEGVVPVVVERPNYEIPETVEELISAGEAIRIESSSPLSSTMIRTKLKAERPVYALRCDGERATAYLKPLIPDYDKRIKAFREGLEEVFSHKNLLLIDVEEQLRKGREYIEKKYSDLKVLSCDVYYRGDENVRVSRVFDVSSAQSRSSGLTFVDWSSLPDEYVYIDDDIATHFTLQEFSKNVEIKDSVSLLEISRQGEIEDVVDERDFLIGAEYGGLMTEGNIRFPYMSPYVNLITRAKIEPERLRETNRKLWKLNAEFYRGTNLKPEQINAPFLETLGVEESIEEFCLLMERSFL